MENYNQIRNYDTNQHYNSSTYDTVGMIGRPSNQRVGYNGIFKGWGYSTIQQPQPEIVADRYSAQISNIPKVHSYDPDREDDFERSVHENRDYEQPRNKSPSTYSDSVYGEEQKINHNMSLRGSMMFGDGHAPSTLCVSEEKNYRTQADIMSLSKPKEIKTEQSVDVKNLYEKSMRMQISKLDNDSYHTYLTIKIESRYDANRQKQSLHLELTDQQNPLFLYTCDISEKEYANIKTNLSLRIDFQNFSTHLASSLDKCFDCQNSRDYSDSYH